MALPRNNIRMEERKLAIVLLDLIGSTSFVQKYGAARAALHFQVHDRLTRSLLYKFNGREIDRSDGFLCSFETPIEAINFALHYQRSIPKKIGLGCRIGIHWDTIIEVHQSDIWVAANAKRIELEGLAKNIAARTMSLCGPSQVLLTDQAMDAVRGRTNYDTPKSARYVFVGSYKFKGVKEPQKIYAVGETIESLQPPKDSEKARKVKGPRNIKIPFSKLTTQEKIDAIVVKLSLYAFLVLLFVFYRFISTDLGRDLLGLQYLSGIDEVNQVISEFWGAVISFLKGHT